MSVINLLLRDSSGDFVLEEVVGEFVFIDFNQIEFGLIFGESVMRFEVIELFGVGGLVVGDMPNDIFVRLKCKFLKIHDVFGEL